MQDYMTLRGAILSKFKTIGDFSVAIDWKRSKASRIINGIQEPDTKDIQELAEVLNINSADNFMNIFFPALSTKWTS